MLISEFLTKARLKHNNFFSYDSILCLQEIKQMDYIYITCPKHNNFRQQVRKHLAGHGCKKCHNEKLMIPQPIIIQRMKNKFGDRFNYDKFIYNGYFEQSIIICKNHGELNLSASIHLGSEWGCNKCYEDQKNIYNQQMLKPFNIFVNQANIIHNYKYDYSLAEKDYMGAHHKIIIICPIHGQFSQAPNLHITKNHQNGCPNCAHVVSKPEIEWLNLLNIPEECRNVKIKIGDRNFKLDALVGKKIFEFNGDFWHGNPAKFDSNKINPIVKKTYGELYQKTINKKLYLENQGYKVISIWEADFLKQKKDREMIEDKIKIENINEENLTLTPSCLSFNRIKKIETVDVENIKVYDLKIKDTKSYGNNNIILHNGGGKRKGSICAYLEPWHNDIFSFLDLRKNNGKEELRARDLNIALWVPDLFFKRVKNNEKWTLIDPNKCKGLADVCGEEFEKLYTHYEKTNMGEQIIEAKDLWSAMLTSQIETGQPYILAKDACNIKSNQKNLGNIYSSNLCSEIIQYSDPTEIATCNLSSISLPSCLEGKRKNKTFNFQKLYETTRILTDNLNKVIDIEYYPVEAAKKSNLRHRPIGIGMQGLSDVFAQMRYSWESEEAKILNKQIAETMYYAALDASCDLAKEKGTYETYQGSPISEGKLQFDLWNVKPSDLWDWDKLRAKIKANGIRNSLLIALMPTASTSQILGNTESFEIITSNIYKRSTLSGEFIQINKYLVEDLMELNLWSEEIRQKIISNNGSIQAINEIPDDIKKLYKTVFEISQKIVIDFAADRAPFVCQSQSMNLYFKDANFGKLSSAFMYGWQKGLKTLVYYTRTTAARDTTKFTVDKEIENQVSIDKEKNEEALVCSLENPENCEACSG